MRVYHTNDTYKVLRKQALREADYTEESCADCSHFQRYDCPEASGFDGYCFEGCYEGRREVDEEYWCSEHASKEQG